MTVVTKTDIRRDADRMRALEARTLAVFDKAEATGDAGLHLSANAVLEYLREPGADPSTATALVTALERKANGGKSPGPATVPAPVVKPGTVDAAAPKPVQAGTFEGWAWWSTLSDTQRAVYGVGVVALLVLAFKLWSDKK